jgi:hypothetical protein
MDGYAHREYIQSLSSYGQPVPLPCSGGWLLERAIPGCPDLDAMGPYPLFTCRDWSALGSDLEAVGERWVSLAIVADPFGKHNPKLLKQAFKDVVFPFKEHYIVDLRRPVESFVSNHHRRNARKALQSVEVNLSREAMDYLDSWLSLYHTLIERHQIKGIPAFSRQSFALQLQTPGLVMFRGVSNGETVGILLWYVMEGIGYYHLGAYNPEGYRLKASFALFWRAIEYFAELGLDWLVLGAGAGVNGSSADGLSRFKRGWATGTRTAYFCGRIFKPDRYAAITGFSGREGTTYFPAYRRAEFG